jgi:hypothetical protein
MREKLGWPTFPYLIGQYLNIFMRNVSMFLPPVKTVFIDRRFISGSALQVVIEIKTMNYMLMEIKVTIRNNICIE